MDFDLSAEQALLQQSVRRLLSREYSYEQRGSYLGEPSGWSRGMWAKYAELGILGVPIAEEDGGFGGDDVDLMIVMEEFGRALLLEPFLSSVVLSVRALQSADNEAAARRLLPRIARGQTLVAFAHSERSSRYAPFRVGTRASRIDDQWRLDGEKSFVAHGDSADALIVSARVSGERDDSSGLAVFLVDPSTPGVSRVAYTTYDGTRACDVRLTDVRLGADTLLSGENSAAPLIRGVIEAGVAAVCAEALGAMTVAFETTVEYLKTRRQFGVAIGSFQVLQHRCVEMLIALEQARSMAMFAAMAMREPDDCQRRKALSAAKVQIATSGRFIAQQSVQLHGAIGMTLDYKIGGYFRRLTALENMFGDAQEHLDLLAKFGGLIEPAVSRGSRA